MYSAQVICEECGGRNSGEHSATCSKSRQRKRAQKNIAKLNREMEMQSSSKVKEANRKRNDPKWDCPKATGGHKWSDNWSDNLKCIWCMCDHPEPELAKPSTIL